MIRLAFCKDHCRCCVSNGLGQKMKVFQTGNDSSLDQSDGAEGEMQVGKASSQCLLADTETWREGKGHRGMDPDVSYSRGEIADSH